MGRSVCRTGEEMSVCGEESREEEVMWVGMGGGSG